MSFPESLGDPIIAPNLAMDGNEDWPKDTLDLESTNVEDLRVEIEALGWTVDDFKRNPAYLQPLASGNYEWLRDL